MKSAPGKIFMRLFIFLFGFLFVGLFIITYVHAENFLILNSVADATILQQTPDTNYGNQTNIAVGYSTVDSKYRHAVLKFDISSIQENATVSNALLRVYSIAPCTGTLDPNEIRVNQLVEHDWVENEVTWTNTPYFGSTFWNSRRTGDCIANSWMEFDILPIVQHWMAGQNNYGIILYSSATTYYTRFFSSKEGELNYRPQISLTYTIPDPTPSITPTPSLTPNPTTAPIITSVVVTTPASQIVSPTLTDDLLITTSPSGPFDSFFMPFSPLITGTFGPIVICICLVCLCLFFIILLTIFIKHMKGKSKPELQAQSSSQTTTTDLLTPEINAETATKGSDKKTVSSVTPVTNKE